MKLIPVFFAVLFFLPFLLSRSTDSYPVHQGGMEDRKMILSTATDDDVFVVQSFLDLDSDGKEESLLVHSYTGLPGEERTEVFLNDADTPLLSLAGYFEGVFVHDIDHTQAKFLEIRTSSGHSINSRIYRYNKRALVMIPVSTEKEGFFEGVASRNPPEFKDVDGDGMKEMVIFRRQFPPDHRRTVEVYQLKERRFEKLREYEEETQELFL